MRIIVTGSLAYDYIMNFPGKFSDHILPDKVHMLTVSFLVDSMKKMRGGTAGNIAYTVAMLGGKSAVVSAAGQDFNEYMKSLHMDEGMVSAQFGYINGPGSDTPGDVRADGAAWTPIVAVNSTASITNPYAAGVATYYDASTKSFVEFSKTTNSWVAVDQSRIDKMNTDKSYIRMPSMPTLLFLNPRDIFYGVKLTFDL